MEERQRVAVVWSDTDPARMGLDEYYFLTRIQKGALFY
jgi:hypothetical protein